MKLGVCYYPEHWPESQWADDAKAMAALGLSLVRIGEFAWARFEPEPGVYDWAWFDRAIETLAGEGLGLILGTPTATPPKWLIDQHPEILPVGADGRTRGFGSRRHYDFSSVLYRERAARITTAMAQRYGRHPAVKMWQTDNEYGCHDTVESYSPAAAAAFRVWLAQRYGDVAALNEAWGAVFWSQIYRSFEEVDPPSGTVTEANPSHRLDYQRFCSDQVARFNRDQLDILRALSPGRAITHNFMGGFTAFDHHVVGADLDMATWDSYPLGFLDQSPTPEPFKQRWLHQGHPDFQGFHHDLYRGCSPQWGVMEQQPGPVNWAPFNPAPLPGMVRLWSLEALAHGAALVSWFRWRQVPFAQEHMHAGLQRPDGAPAQAYEEARQVADDIKTLGAAETARAPVALVFDYEGQWTWSIQPQGQGLDLLRQAFEAYSALRQLGLDIDIVSPGADLSGYQMIVLPGLPILSDALVDALERCDAQLLALPRTGAKTEHFHIPEGLAPGRLKRLIDVTVAAVESLRPGAVKGADLDGAALTIANWREHVETRAQVRARYCDGAPLWVRQGKVSYLAGWLHSESLMKVIAELAGEAGLSVRPTGPDLRLRRLGGLQFAFNYGPDPVSLGDIAPADPAAFVLGGPELAPAGVSAWKV